MSFTAEVQMEMSEELSRYEDEQTSSFEELNEFIVFRTTMMEKVCKYPTIMDYQWSILQAEELFWWQMKFKYCDLRNSYLLIHDFMMKNEGKMEEALRYLTKSKQYKTTMMTV
jgi:hypothetical protein